MFWTSVIRPRVRPSCFDTVDKTLLRLTVPKGRHRFSVCRWPVSMALRSGSSLLTVDDAHLKLHQFFKVATGSESSGDEFGVLEDDRCIDTGRARVVFRLQPAPAAALPDQPYNTQAMWCAIRAVARCELVLFPVIKTPETGAPVYWH